MPSVNTNLSSLIVQTNLKSSTKRLNIAIERMSTGFKINHAKDNAANYSIKTKLSSKISSYEVAEENAMMGLDMLETSSEALNHIEENLARIRSLAVQAQNGTYGEKSLIALNSEAQALMNEISRLNETAQYNGIKLFNTGKAEITNAGKELELNEQGFLQEVIVRDTSTMTKLSTVDETQALAIGTYSISTKEELVQMTNMLEKGLIASNTEFVLANDIDLSGIHWKSTKFDGVFDGNGHTIKNLTGENGLFSSAEMVKNVKLENVNISSTKNEVGGIAGSANITNCTITGKISSTGNNVGGVVGYNYYRYPKYCYSDVEVSGRSFVGGIAGWLNYSSATGCVSRGEVSGTSNVGGISGLQGNMISCASYAEIYGKTNIGGISGSSNSYHFDVYFAGTVNGEENVGGINGNNYNNQVNYSNLIMEGVVNGKTNVGVFIGNTQTSCNVTNSFYYKKNTGRLPLLGGSGLNTKLEVKDITIPTEYYLQIGINSDSKSSGITLTTYVDFSALSSLLQTGIEDESVLKQIDTLVNQVSLKQTEIGTAQNGLSSVLEEISIKYDNLVSSRSTIQDADIAEESSAYIRNQILQQAAATLLATANQTPSIALQLL
ncbi:flagellin [Acinetobacter sp. CAG:196]|nr:flagellin [Acinetobacter sp. CAG:196]